MSQENVEIVRQAWAAFARRDNESALRFYDPEVEVHERFDGRVYRGVDGVREFFHDWLEDWDGFGSEIEEWIDAGDHVIAIVHVWGRGKQSGVSVEAHESHVWTLRDGKLWRFRIYKNKYEALDAVELRE